MVMTTMADIPALAVRLYGKRIGMLTLLPGDRTLFTFDQGYIDDPARPTLSLSFTDSLGELITDIRPTRTRVPPFFANLLPEGALRDYLANKAGVNPKREFFLLAVVERFIAAWGDEALVGRLDQDVRNGIDNLLKKIKIISDVQ